jgi:hypothetical protein
MKEGSDFGLDFTAIPDEAGVHVSRSSFKPVERCQFQPSPDCNELKPVV